MPSPRLAPEASRAVSTTDYEQYFYDAADNRTSLRKRDGTTIGYAYDALNRVTSKTVPTSATGAAGYSVHYDYDIGNRQTEARFGSLTGPGVSQSYDMFGRQVSTTTNMDGTARTLLSQYDAGSRRTVLWDGGVSYSGGYSWDAAGRLTRYDEGMNALALRPLYDAQGRRTSLGYVVNGGNVSAAYYQYDFMSRLTSLGQELAGTSHDLTLGFGYNRASQISSRTSTNESYSSNTAANAQRSYSVNGLNQYTQVAPAGFATQAFGYDANGNLQSDGVTTYVYDAENRLVSATSAAGTTTLSYDPLGRLWQVARGGTATRFLYDGDDLIQERDGNGTLLRAYVHAPGSGDEPLMWYEYTTGFSRRFLHADHQGSIVAASDSSGTSIATAAYDAWGIPNQATVGVQAGGVGRFGYTGQAWIPELGMYHYKARVYSPTLGRFLQTDPVGYDDQINLYAYVSNDPLNRTDPTGMMQDSFELATRRDDLAYLNGEISAAEYRERQQARGLGGVVGAGIVGVGIATRGLGLPAFVKWVGGILGRQAAPTLSQATQAAMRGGPNASLLRTFAERSTTSLQRTVRSLERQIAHHREKIANPAAHMRRESANDAAAVQRAVRDWQREITNYSNQRDIARDVLRSR